MNRFIDKSLWSKVAYVLMFTIAKALGGRKSYLQWSWREGINLIPGRTVWEYIVYPRNSSILVHGALAILVFSLYPWVEALIFPSADCRRSNREQFLTSISLSLGYAFAVRLLGVGAFDIDTILLRSLVLFLMFKIRDEVMRERYWNEGRW